MSELRLPHPRERLARQPGDAVGPRHVPPRHAVDAGRRLVRGPLPALGVGGSLATTGKDLPCAGKVHAETGTTVGQNDGGGIEIQAQNLENL